MAPPPSAAMRTAATPATLPPLRRAAAAAAASLLAAVVAVAAAADAADAGRCAAGGAPSCPEAAEAAGDDTDFLQLGSVRPQPDLDGPGRQREEPQVRAPRRKPELFVPLPRNAGGVVLSTVGKAFHVRLIKKRCEEPIDTPMVAPDDRDCPWRQVRGYAGRGITSAFGSVTLSRSGRLSLRCPRGALLTRSEPIDLLDEVTFSAAGGLIYGSGAGPAGAVELTSYGNVTPVVQNWYGQGSETKVPHYYSTDGYVALGVTDVTFNTTDGAKLSATYDAQPARVKWRNVRAGRFELYLMPAASLELGTKAYYSLVGRPRVPPRWTFGFMASRWGWKDKAYIDRTLKRFRTGRYPADAFITDFEWYSNESDYALHSEGVPFCHDFGFWNRTFPKPAEQISNYRRALNFHMAGIRKPRLCNSELLAYARSQGWILPQGCPGGDASVWYDVPGYYGVGRQLNMSDPSCREWYAGNMEHYLRDGVAFWWDDEGETDYFTYYWWNLAEIQAQHAVERKREPNKRYYALNRNFSPGMARMGVGVWTGDSGTTWECLALQPGYLLNWALAGAPYVGSDIGGFAGNTSAELLTRWYQVGVFMPIMRVHSTLEAIPHWPWLWGEAAGQNMRQALELRYRLVPYHYSLAHAMYRSLRLWMRPMIIAFPGEAAVANLTSQWMDGDLLVAPVLRNDSRKHVHLPAGLWYPFDGGDGSQPPVRGPAEITGAAEMSELPVFAPSGSIVSLAPVVQYTDALPGGPLEVRVYAGADSRFDLYEDDGESLAYEAGLVKVTHLRWCDATRVLSWRSKGRVANGFTRLFLRVFETSGGCTRSAVTAFSSHGTVAVPSIT